MKSIKKFLTRLDGKSTRNIYQNIPFAGIPLELQSVSEKFRCVPRAIEKFFQKSKKTSSARKQRKIPNASNISKLAVLVEICFGKNEWYVTPFRIVYPWQTLRPKFARFIIEFHAVVRARTLACTSVSHAWRERTLGRIEAFVPRANVLSRIVTFCPRERAPASRYAPTRTHADPSVSTRACSSRVRSF